MSLEGVLDPELQGGLRDLFVRRSSWRCNCECHLETGLAGTPVVGGGDCQLGMIGVGACEPGQAGVFGGSFWQYQQVQHR